MTGPNRWFVKTSLLLLFCSLVLAGDTRGQTPDMRRIPLVFDATPSRQLLKRGEAVVLVLELRNQSEEPVFVSHLKSGEFVDLNVIGPDGKEVPWLGTGRIDSKAYSPSDFAVLKRYEGVTAERIISLKDGTGFLFEKPGQYSVTAEYSLGPPEYFAPFAGGTKVPTDSVRSTKAAFCIEVCIQGPMARGVLVHRQAPESALEAVRVFYSYITRYRPLGIPRGREREALWPLLSKRLGGQLDSLTACEDDYYRRYSGVLEANHFKPATPWLEEGLFSGPSEAAAPMRVSILSSRLIGEKRVDVHLRFTHQPTSQEHFEGVANVILENSRWLIDDFVAMYENDELVRLSDGYSECKGGRWVGNSPQ